MMMLCFWRREQAGDMTKEQYEVERARILGKKVGDGAIAEEAAGDAAGKAAGGPSGYVPPHTRNRGPFSPGSPPPPRTAAARNGVGGERGWEGGGSGAERRGGRIARGGRG